MILLRLTALFLTLYNMIDPQYKQKADGWSRLVLYGI